MMDIQMIAKRLLEELRILIDAPIIISDTNGFIIAGTEETRLNQFHEGVPPVGRDRRPVYISHLQAQSLQGAREEILTPLLIDEIPLGVLGIEGPIAQVEPYSKIMTKMAEMLIEKALLSEDYNPETQLVKLFLTELLGGQLTKEAIVQQLERLQLEDIYERAAIIEVDTEIEAIVIRHLIHTQMIHPQLLMTRWNINQVVLLIPKIARTQLEEALLLLHQKLTKLTHAHVKIGVGKVSPLPQLTQSYQEAVKALAVCSAERAIVFEEDLKLELLLLNSTRQQREEYIKRMLGPILYESELLKNLEVWLNSNQSMKDTADQLHIHKNTLKYRIKKIEQALQVDLHNIKDQASLYIALFLYKQHYIGK
ncbi:MAG: sugar diacid recognition domain-containing protein [Lysinibacillus sp.]